MSKAFGLISLKFKRSSCLVCMSLHTVCIVHLLEIVLILMFVYWCILVWVDLLATLLLSFWKNDVNLLSEASYNHFISNRTAYYYKNRRFFCFPTGPGVALAQNDDAIEDIDDSEDMEVEDEEEEETVTVPDSSLSDTVSHYLIVLNKQSSLNCLGQ